MDILRIIYMKNRIVSELSKTIIKARIGIFVILIFSGLFSLSSCAFDRLVIDIQGVKPLITNTVPIGPLLGN